ncbi:MAG: histidine kinase [Micropruina sp.]|uniref:sensor histidine kinase n=1 Tax=Micropruina sp. TaxID=2737536 RepID=UPI0039E2E8DF
MAVGVFMRAAPASRLPLWIAAPWATFCALSTLDDLRLRWPDIVATPENDAAYAIQLVLIALSLATAGYRPRFSMVVGELALGMSLLTSIAGFASFAVSISTVQTAALCRSRLVVVHAGVAASWLAWLWAVNPRQEYWGVATGILLAAGVGFLVRFLLLRSEASHQRLAEVAANAQKARERERAALARRLHDSVASELTRVSLRVSSVEGSTDATEQAEALAEIRTTALKALHELSVLVEVLTSDDEKAPALGDDHDEFDPPGSAPSLASLRAEAVGTLRAAGFMIVEPASDTDGGEEDPALVETRSGVLQQVLKEGVTNVLKHGQPGGRCTLDIRQNDDGIALELSNEVAEGPTAGIRGNRIGLRSIRSRVEAAGGDVSIGQSAGIWTLGVWLPYSRIPLAGTEPGVSEPLRLGQTSPSS